MSRRQREPANTFYLKTDPNPPLYPEPWEGDTYFNTLRKVLRVYTDGRWQDVNAMRWIGEYIPSDNRWYYPGDVVRDGEWLMLCINVTQDRPAPILRGEPFYLYDGTNPTVTQTVASVSYGTRFEITQNDPPIVIQGWRGWFQQGVYYTAWLVNDPDGVPRYTQMFADVASTATGWVEVLSKPTIAPSETTFEIWVTARSNTGTVSVGPDDWEYLTPNNEDLPASGQVVHPNRTLDILRFHKTDYLGADQSTALSGLNSGDVIAAGDIRWTIIGAQDQGDFIDFTVAPTRQLATDGITSFTAETTQTISVEYLKDVDYWLTSPVNAKGLTSTDGAIWTPDDNAYGVDLKVQNVSYSPDWTVLSK